MRRRRVQCDPDLAICPNCGSDAASLGDYGPADEAHYYLHILCGNCLVWRYIEASDEDCQWFEAFVLEGYNAVLAREAARLDTDRFKDWAAMFIVSLQRDAIQPMDF